MTDYHKKDKKELVDEIKELRHSLAVAANGPAVNRLKKEVNQYLRDMIKAKQDNVELRDEILALKAELFELRKFQQGEVEHDCRPLNQVVCNSVDGYSVVYDRQTMELVKQ